MRIVIDLQGAQSTGSRTRGIGRYTMSLTRAIINNRKDHEIILALNGLFPETIEPIRAAFDELLPQDNIRVWYVPGPVAFHDTKNHWRKGAAEKVREAFLASIRPDIVLVSSLFEGFGDDAVTSVESLPQTIPTAVILYDLIPYIHSSPYLDNPSLNVWYRDKIEQVLRCDLWLAISESSRQEGVEHLGLPGDRAVNVSTDADACFQPLSISEGEETSVRAQYGLYQPFVMYTGGIDHRKNIDGLIRAFAKLPKKLRVTHQLAIVCSAKPEERQNLEHLAEKLGINKGKLVLTGFVPEDHLLALYNLCTLFIFPSWHEGFGLPALEAIRCGAPVIGANTSSLPEVIGWEDALFDPRSDDDMAAVMERALSDEKFRKDLIANGKAHSQKFSWDKSAVQAIKAMEHLHSTRQLSYAENLGNWHRPKLAYVSPLPPERSGIADYSAELLAELSKHYEVDVIVTQEQISDWWVTDNCAVRSAEWLIEYAGQYDRVLYHFGNSAFHQHMFALLEKVPGVVVLHDFFLSGIVAHMDFHGASPNRWARELYESHGYKAMYDRFHCAEHAEVIWQYPCSLSVIQNSLGLIVHSANSLRLAESWYGEGLGDWALIPHMRDPKIDDDKLQARKELGLNSDDFLVCTFGMLAPTKLNKNLLNAWLNSELAGDKTCHLIFVGENDCGSYGQELLTMIRRARGKNRIHITGWTEKETFRKYLAAADVGVQLRTLSRGETSGTVLDCMNFSLPTIVNANGSMADLDSKAVWKLPNEFSNEQLVEALETLRQDKTLRQSMGETARNVILKRHDPQKCAGLYQEAIERFYHLASTGSLALPDAIAGDASSVPDDVDLISLADAIALNFPPRNRKRQLLVDISGLVQHDANTNIQRVIHTILCEWLHNPPNNYRIEPVYATSSQPYRYARRFTARFLGVPEKLLFDEPIDYAGGDIFLGLDMQHQIVPAHREFYQTLRRQGVQVNFIVYDLLCISLPQFFVAGAANGLSPWLEVVSESDGAICISKSVASDLSDWLEINGPAERPFEVSWFHLGGDMNETDSSQSLSPEVSRVPKQLTERLNFLMLDTLEPRKGHTQVLDAFEQLWQNGENINLIIVGKQGLMTENLVERLFHHSERSKRLYWFDSISDEYLEKVLATTTCLIAASHGEGFGLPLIEAAQHKLPIIVREIPVFREVAGDHAYYFDSEDPEALADAIKDWIKLYEKGRHPTSHNMPWLTWKESAAQLMDVLIHDSDPFGASGDEAVPEKDPPLQWQA